MLFLHALLFFILGTFAVAAPMDSNTSKPSVQEVKKRLLGYWISDRTKPSLGKSPIPDMIYIKEEYEYDKGKVKVEVICPIGTTEEKFKEVFGPTHTWKRITSDDAYQKNRPKTRDGSLRSPQHPTAVEKDHDGDELKMSLDEYRVAHLQITTVDVKVAGVIIWSSTPNY